MSSGQLFQIRRICADKLLEYPITCSLVFGGAMSLFSLFWTVDLFPKLFTTEYNPMYSFLDGFFLVFKQADVSANGEAELTDESSESGNRTC
jgi:hypothetical protein